jgi:hypothetical protein
MSPLLLRRDFPERVPRFHRRDGVIGRRGVELINLELGGSNALGNKLFHFEVVLRVLFHEPPFIKRTCAFRTEFRIVVFALRIAAKARSSGLRENPRIATTSVQGHVHSLL